jgi:hypothetical protein
MENFKKFTLDISGFQNNGKFKKYSSSYLIKLLFVENYPLLID